MHKRIIDSALLLTIGVLFFVLSFPMNDWFSLTMPRHQILQLPAMLVLGMGVGIIFKKINIRDTSWGIAVLIIVMATLIFWMLPRSIDLTIVYPWFNRVMHVTMLLAGFFTIVVWRNMIFEIKIAFPGMVAAMVLATGMALRTFTILLCSSFTLEQQKETGLYLIVIGFVLFVFMLAILFRELGRARRRG
ncbi:MAG: hypothetical protein JSS93_11030 [Bacteroidetes bacterium]|nr:hypothetical protein [Bacteroidota bacterium]